MKGRDREEHCGLPSFDGIQLMLADSVKSPDVILAPALLLAKKINAVSTSTFFQLSSLEVGLHPYLDSGDLATLIHAIRTERLE